MGKIERITLNLFNEPRTIRVYLPTNLNRNYPVLYMHDGHNLFDVEASYGGVVWDVHGALDRLEQKSNQSLIVVGIDCHPTNRLDEYSPWPNENLTDLFPKGSIFKGGGKGTEYIDWIVNRLKPYIDQHYPTIKDKTYLAGSSMGGLISLYGGYRYPDVFKVVGAFSSSFWFAKKQITNYIKVNHNPNLAVYLDVGTNEASDDKLNKRYLDDNQSIANLLKDLETKNFKYYVDEGGEHNELTWQKRFPNFLEWLLKQE